jgi:hypothetical protein
MSRLGHDDAAKEPFRMTQVTIENPILTSPYDEPTRHFRFSDEGITNKVLTGRRSRGADVPDSSRRCPDWPTPEGFLARL